MPDDLAIDLASPDRTATAVAVIARCCVAAPTSPADLEDAAWNLPISTRIARLLRILQLSTEEETFTATAPCPVCREPLELPLPFATLLSNAQLLSSSSKVIQFPVAAGASIALRVPSGRDQVAWRAQAYASEAHALTAIVRSLAVEPAALPSLSDEQLSPLGAVMEEADPLVAFAVQTTCPHCASSADIAVGLEAAALQQLSAHRRSILRDVHELATRYGWTEAEILAIPPARRAGYRRLIAAEGKAPS